jgi:hypothetical protein
MDYDQSAPPRCQQARLASRVVKATPGLSTDRRRMLRRWAKAAAEMVPRWPKAAAEMVRVPRRNETT